MPVPWKRKPGLEKGTVFSASQRPAGLRKTTPFARSGSFPKHHAAELNAPSRCGSSYVSLSLTTERRVIGARSLIPHLSPKAHALPDPGKSAPRSPRPMPCAPRPVPHAPRPPLPPSPPPQRFHLPFNVQQEPPFSPKPPTIPPADADLAPRSFPVSACGQVARPRAGLGWPFSLCPTHLRGAFKMVFSPLCLPHPQMPKMGPFSYQTPNK